MLWATQVADIVKASGDDLLTFKVNDNTALDVLLRKIKDLLLQYTYDLHGAFMVAVQALVHPENIHLQNALYKTPLYMIVYEMTNEENYKQLGENKQGLQLYVDAADVLARCIHENSEDYEIKLSEVLDLVVRCKKEFRNACPVYWYNLCKCLVQHGANVTYKEPGQEFLLVTLTCNLQALLPWSSAELRNNYINVIELLSTPETVESSQPDSMSALQYLVVLSGNIFTKPGSAKTVTQMLDTMLKFCQDPKYQLGAAVYQLMLAGEGLTMRPPCNKAWADVIEYCVTRGASLTYQGDLGSSVLHALVTLPSKIKEPTEENVEAFARVLDLVVTPETVAMRDITGITALDGLKNKAGAGTTPLHTTMFTLAKRKLVGCQMSRGECGKILYHTVKACTRDSFKKICASPWAAEVEDTFTIGLKTGEILVYHDDHTSLITALHWLFEVIDEIFPYPTTEQMSAYMRVLRLFLSPDFLLSGDRKDNTPLDYVLYKSVEILKVRDGVGFYTEVVETMLKAYCDCDTDCAVYSKALGVLLDQHVLATMPGCDLYFDILDKIVACGAAVPNEILNKYLVDKDGEDAIKFRAMMLTHTKVYTILMERFMLATKPVTSEVRLTWGLNNVINIFSLPRPVCERIHRIQNLIESKGMSSTDDMIEQIKMLCHADDKQTLRTILKENNGNWMCRTSFHFMAMLCEDRFVYDCIAETYKELGQEEKRDLHGNTPHILAILHGNTVAAEFFKKHGSCDDADVDYYNCTPQDILDRSDICWRDGVLVCPQHLTGHCDLTYFSENATLAKSLDKKSPGARKALPRVPREKQEIHDTVWGFFTQLSDQICKKHPWLESVLRMAGSVGERTKIGRMDEFDVQFIYTILSKKVKILNIGNTDIASIQLEDHADLPGLCSDDGTFDVHKFGQIIHEGFLEALKTVDFTKVPLRVTKTSHPWELVWEGSGPMKGLPVSIDVVPIVIVSLGVVETSLQHGNRATSSGIPEEFDPEMLKRKQGDIILDPVCRPLKLFLRWGRPGREHRFVPTIADSERDIVDSMPNQVRTAIRVVKSLLEAAYWQHGAYYADVPKPITSYMVKNAIFWLLSTKISGKPVVVEEQLQDIVQSMAFFNESLQVFQSLQGMMASIPNKAYDQYTKSNRLQTKINVENDLVPVGSVIDYGQFMGLMKSSVTSNVSFGKGILEMAQMGLTPAKEPELPKSLTRDDSKVEERMPKLLRTSRCDVMPGVSDAGTGSGGEERIYSRRDDTLLELMATKSTPQTDVVEDTRHKEHKENTEDEFQWAYQIVEYIKSETEKTYGLAVYYSARENHAYLINKWNSRDICKMCDKLLHWLS